MKRIALLVVLTLATTSLAKGGDDSVIQPASHSAGDAAACADGSCSTSSGILQGHVSSRLAGLLTRRPLRGAVRHAVRRAVSVRPLRGLRGCIGGRCG